MLKSEKTLFSCEIFPPKQGGELNNAFQLIDEISDIRPDFISVTCGAAGNTAGLTQEIAQHIEGNGVTALAHLTRLSALSVPIEDIIKGLRDSGVTNILALRGDIPKDSAYTAHQVGQASDLVETIRELGDFCIGAACYPDGHVESQSQQQDIRYLKMKVDSGCDFLITQMFFDNDQFYRFKAMALENGITVPLLAGIMPVTSRKQIRRLVEISGTPMPPRLRIMIDRYGDNPRSMAQAGVLYACEQILDLVANGVRGIHLYTMNHPEIARRIREYLRDIL